MTGWYEARKMQWPTKALIAVAVLAVVLVAAVPLALFAGIIMMLLGHVVGGLALFGGSILAAVAGVMVAGMSGMRHLRKLISRPSFHVIQLDRADYTDYR